MAFFSDLGKKVSQVSQGAIQKTKDMADVAKLNSTISDEEKKVQNLYNVVGKLYFEKHENDCEDAFKEAVMAIRTSLDAIENTQKQIQDIKSALHCPNCGAEIPGNTLFCGSCGFRLPEQAQQPQQPQATAPTDTYAQQYAPSYGTTPVAPAETPVQQYAPSYGQTVTPVVPVPVEPTSPVVNETQPTEIVESEVEEQTEMVENTELVQEEVVETVEEKLPEVQVIDAEEAMQDEAEDVLTAETAVDFAAAQNTTDASMTYDAPQENKESQVNKFHALPYKFCGNCGAKMEQEAMFCPECGTKCN